jgi:phage terminase small subunit
MKLTPKQKAFVREYKKNGGNGTQAAIKAGYSEKTARKIASENVTKPDIQEALKQEEKKLQEKYEYTIDDMVRELDDVKMKADAEQNRQAQIKAIELKGKAFGLFVDRQEITGKDGKDLIPVIEIQPVKASDE